MSFLCVIVVGEVFIFDQSRDHHGYVYIEWSGPWRHHSKTNLFLTCNIVENRLEVRDVQTSALTTKEYFIDLHNLI